MSASLSVYLSPHMVPSLTDSPSLTTSPVSAPASGLCWCWQASSHGESLSTAPRQPLVWGKIRQVLHHHCVENNINSDVKYGIRIQSRLSWGIFSVLQITKMLNDSISHTWAVWAEGQSPLEPFILATQSASRQDELSDGDMQRLLLVTIFIFTLARLHVAGAPLASSDL